MKEKCADLIAMIEDGIRWSSQHVGRDRGQQDIISQLKTQRRLARRLEYAASLRPGIAIFGASQHGKSYLVSNMVRGERGEALSVLVPGSGQNVDFQRDINPEGGQESTGTVTRFTVDSRLPSGQAGIQLELLSQADVVAVLADGFLANIKIESTLGDGIDRDALQATFARLRGAASAEPVAGMTEDDIHDIKDYVCRVFPSDYRIIDLTRLGYWDDAAELAPRLPTVLRWEIFQFLWGCNAALTDLFKRLSDGLLRLGHSRFAATDINAFVPKLADGRPQTIIDVNVVSEIAQEVESLPPVTLRLASGLSVSLPRGVTTALVKEIIFSVPPEIATGPELGFLKEGDVLDFPGARSAKQIFATWLTPGHKDFVVTIKELFVRGKVSFLFKSYDEQHRFTSLVICQRDSNVEVNITPFLSYEWIAKNIGSSANHRLSRRTNFFMVFTFWNNELAKSASSTDAHATKWQARLAKNFVEEWKRGAAEDDWINNWTPGTPFRNCFVIRDPKYSGAVFASSPEGLETEVRSEWTEQLAEMRRSFLSSSIVKKHIADPEKMWDGSALPNRTGMSLLLGQLSETFSADDRTQQISSQLKALRASVQGILGPHYHDENKAKERERAEREARKSGAAIWGMLQKGSFGLFLDRLYVSEEMAWKAYFDVENPSIDAAGGAEKPDIEVDSVGDLVSGLDPGAIFGFDFGLPATAVTKTKAVKKVAIWNKADAVADNLLDRWSRMLSEFCDDPEALRTFGFDREAAQGIISGLKDTAQRARLRDRVRDCVRPGVDNSPSGSRIDLYSQLAAATVNAFVNDLDWGAVAEDVRPTVRLPNSPVPVPLFSKRGKPVLGRKSITLETTFPGLAFSTFWLQGLMSAIISNVDEITFDAEANRLLGALIQRVEAFAA